MFKDKENRSGLGLFIVLHLFSIILDVGTTLIYVSSADDWGFSKEFNPFIRGTSTGTMVVHLVVASIIITMVFCASWLNRRRLYPPADTSFSTFLEYVFHGKKVHSAWALPSFRNYLILFGISVPIASVVAHLQASITNLLQTLNLFAMNRMMALALITIEVTLSFGLGLVLLFRDFRKKSSPEKE